MLHLTKISIEIRECQAQDFKRKLDTHINEQEKRYTEIRKYEYMRVRNEVKRGLRDSAALAEWELWRGF